MIALLFYWFLKKEKYKYYLSQRPYNKSNVYMKPFLCKRLCIA